MTVGGAYWSVTHPLSSTHPLYRGSINYRWGSMGQQSLLVGVDMGVA